jgi:branched-chain amino acid transport system ATP-binding protein
MTTEHVSPILSVRGWSCGYQDEAIVRDLDLDLQPGTVTCIVGSNGAGKSTVLRSIYGTIKRFSGSLAFRGKNIERLSPADRAALGMSFVPQGRCNFPYLSVAENLKLGAYNLPKEQSTSAIEKQLRKFPALREKRDMAAGNMSGGEQQMLEMAMVMVVEPALLLIDEPSLGLSPKMMFEVLETIRDLARSGITVLMVEQNVRGGLAISDRVVVMDLGRKIMDGPPAEITADERIRSVFLGGLPVKG